MRTLALTIAALLMAACNPTTTPTTTQQARLRNSPPATCTAAQLKACVAPDVTVCPNGQEPVIDYSSDCCPHFSCQPVCQSAQACPMTPAPACPSGTTLWIGTAVEDCCPAYRCEPDSTQCDPTVSKCGNCDAMGAACSMAMPYCGAGVQPVIVGQTNDCCPIYQCPCAVDANGSMPTDPSCGCTYPNCNAGEELSCTGANICGYPCVCQKAPGTCASDSDCASDERCDTSNCLLAPVTAGSAFAGCDVSKCGNPPPTPLCADGTTPAVSCVADASGSCSWDVEPCVPANNCYGVCVKNIVSGCKADTDCPSGQKCEVACAGWGCASKADPTTGTTSTACACPMVAGTTTPADPSCACDSSGNCSGQTCTGQCVPAITPKCDPTQPVACPAIVQACPNGAQPISTGIDPTTCCPNYQCPACNATASATPVNCPMIAACPAGQCTLQADTDPSTCCPVYKCGTPDAAGNCH